MSKGLLRGFYANSSRDFRSYWADIEPCVIGKPHVNLVGKIKQHPGANLENCNLSDNAISALSVDIGVLSFEGLKNVTRKKELNRQTEITPEQGFWNIILT